MATERGGVVVRQIGHLFGYGTVTGLTEWQLVHRYTRLGDEAAFASLVARHGPMVLGVCRRLLDDPSDVEDAFQATFLVLVRKAAALRPNDPVGNWLHGVARRVALRARSNLARHRTRLGPVDSLAIHEGEAEADVSLSEIREVIDQELARLPTDYRTAVVLCYLEGLSHEDAARQLGWPLGTVKGRLARARVLLRERLTRRGLATTLSAGGLVSWLGRDAKAGVPDAWTETIVKVAMRITAGRTTAGLVPVTAAALAEGVLWAMTIHQLKLAAISLSVLAAVTLAAGAFASQSQERANAPRSKVAVSSSSTRGREGDDSRLAPQQGDARNSSVAASDPSRPARGDDESARRDVETSRIDDAPLRIARQGFAMALEGFVAGRIGVDQVHDWSVRIQEQEFEDADRAHQIEALNQHARRMEQLEVIAQSRGSTGERSSLDILNAQFYRKEAERMVHRFERATPLRPNRPSAESSAPRTVGSTSINPGEESTDRGDNRPGRRASTKGARSDEKTSSEEPGQDARSQAIRKKLDTSIAMSFAQETPLEEVLKHIKTNTVSPDFPSGIAIYVDPIGLQEAEKTLSSPIQLDLDGVPLRRTLHLILKQLGLCYWIQDGMIVISSESDERGPLPSPIHEPPTRQRLENKLQRGELSPEERAEYLEILQDESQIEKLKAEIAKHRANRPAPAGGGGGGFQ
jgi:RNA polymerase sigma factor (sigma-70 family)